MKPCANHVQLVKQREEKLSEYCMKFNSETVRQKANNYTVKEHYLKFLTFIPSSPVARR